MFDKLYYSSDNTSTFTLNSLLEDTISGDWGKPQLSNAFNKKVKIIRGTDIEDIANGGISKAPTRYVKERAFLNKCLMPNDILLEISGGSPTQSTGRSLLLNEEIFKRYTTKLLGTNFTRILRSKSENNAILISSYISFLYRNNVFFNFENGTTGIKNLDYKTILNMPLPDLTKAKPFSKYLKTFKKYYKYIQILGNQSTVLSKIKNELLDFYF